jgi:hypothetical protein
MQEHSFIRKDQRNPKKGRERERERRRRKEGSREDGEAHGRMMDGKLKLGEKCHQITFT